MSESRLPRSAVERLLEVGAEAPDDGAVAAGAELGKYRIVRLLGRGGMGLVYEAEDTELKRRVALKVMPETAGLSEVLRRRFAREAKAAARLSHPNIATVYEATPDYIAMQYVEGIGLLDVPRTDLRFLVRLLRQAAFAVAYAHECGVIHRDLKPSNMVVESAKGGDGPSSRDARIFLMDFGLAKEVALDSSLSGSGNILGTPGYMSPEQAEGRTRDVDERSDVYGLGATLYSCLTGRPPFVDRDVLGTLRKVSEEDARPPRVEPDLDAIVLKCLAKEPERRYQSARELGEDLTRWLEGETDRARPPSVSYRLRKFVARRKAVVKAVIVVVFLAALVLVPTLYGLFRQRVRLADMEDAVRFAERVRVTMANVEIARSQRRLSQVRHTLEAGRVLCEEFVASNPIAPGFYHLGRFQRALNQNQAAIESLDRALDLDPDLVEARFERGLAMLAEFRRQEKLREYEVLGTDPESETLSPAQIEDMRRRGLEDIRVAQTRPERFSQTDVLFCAAEIARLNGSLDQCRSTLENVLRLDPLYLDAIRALARVALERGDDETASKYAAEALDLELGLGLVERTRPTVTPVEEHAPKPDEVLSLPGSELVLSDFEPALQRSSHRACELAQRGVVRSQEAARRAVARDTTAIKAWENARKSNEEALAVDPNLAAAYNNRGVCWAELEKLLRAADRGPQAADRGLRAHGAYRNAMADYEEAIERQPWFPAARRNRAHARMSKAEQLADYGLIQEAALELNACVDDLTQALEFDDEHTSVRIDRARAYARRSNLVGLLAGANQAKSDRNLAEADFDRAVRNKPENVGARYWRAQFRSSVGDSKGALEDYEAALRHAETGWLHRSDCEREVKRLRESD